MARLLGLAPRPYGLTIRWATITPRANVKGWTPVVMHHSSAPGQFCSGEFTVRDPEPGPYWKNGGKPR